MNIIKIVLVDDHSIFSKGLSLLLNGIVDFKVVGDANDAQELLDNLMEWQPDVILMDIKMPGVNGIVATKQALKIMPELRIIALTMFAESHYCKSMAEAGAHGFVQKNVSGAELEMAIRTVVSGKNYFSQPLMKDLQPKEKPDNYLFISEYDEYITEREHEVLTCISQGLSANEIAKKLFISARTVEGHRASLISKTRTRNVVDLIIFSIRNGLLSL